MTENTSFRKHPEEYRTAVSFASTKCRNQKPCDAPSRQHFISLTTDAIYVMCLIPQATRTSHCLSISGKLMRHGAREGRAGSRPPFKIHYPRDRPPAGLRLTDRELAFGRCTTNQQDAATFQLLMPQNLS